MFVFIINIFKQRTVQNENRHNTVIRTVVSSVKGCRWLGLVEKHMVEDELWYGGEDEKPVMGEVAKGGCDMWKQKRKGQGARAAHA